MQVQRARVTGVVAALPMVCKPALAGVVPAVRGEAFPHPAILQTDSLAAVVWAEPLASRVFQPCTQVVVVVPPQHPALVAVVAWVALAEEEPVHVTFLAPGLVLLTRAEVVAAVKVALGAMGAQALCWCAT